MQHGEQSGTSSEQLLADYSVAMLEAFAAVFDVTIEPASDDPPLLSMDHNTDLDARQAMPSTVECG